jgi:hypothetical protein
MNSLARIAHDGLRIGKTRRQRTQRYGKRLVQWFQDELRAFHDGRDGESFALHDFRRTAITGSQMAGVSEKGTSLMVGATPEKSGSITKSWTAW